MEFGTTCSHYFLGLKVKYLNFLSDVLPGTCQNTRESLSTAETHQTWPSC